MRNVAPRNRQARRSMANLCKARLLGALVSVARREGKRGINGKPVRLLEVNKTEVNESFHVVKVRSRR